jgi:hypothetical protein
MIHPQSWCHREFCQPVEAEQPATSRTCTKCGKTAHYPANEVDFICECAQEQGWEDYRLDYNGGTLQFRKPYPSGVVSRLYDMHEAVSQRGFMGFVYRDGRVSLRPCLFSSTGNEMEFPVAVRFANHTSSNQTT